MRRIVCLQGSPRPMGNSASMASALCEAATGEGAQVTTFALNSLEYRGCQGCLLCKTRFEACVLKDGLTPVLEAVRHCDVLVLATPVYFGEVTAQLKAFIDRTYSFLTPDYAFNKDKRTRLAPGKTLCFVIAQGHPREDLFADIFPRYAYFFNWLGFSHSRLLRACKVYHLGDVQKREEVLEEARALGRSLAIGADSAGGRPGLGN
ncbi:MAG: flavodoxin family protein [Humidesulfovibrio sp.]|uniref:flavodoxin family protein n=1 Tax=Humidesulfovibrio sp. TaxID=2910988 RepID=UPI0027332961|nr:flavodoxin family protein [Humidesulfovibrio sp.]MDP2846589.1 flavodoxin family protein [Humidesulfovibrio sp.]